MFRYAQRKPAEKQLFPSKEIEYANMILEDVTDKYVTKNSQKLASGVIK